MLIYIFAKKKTYHKYQKKLSFKLDLNFNLWSVPLTNIHIYQKIVIIHGHNIE